MAKAKDISGHKFGKLIAVSPTARRTPGGGRFWNCQCECGVVCEKAQSALVSGHVSSCGCARRGPKKARSKPAVQNYFALHGPASVSLVARVTGLSRPTVHKIVKHMHKHGELYVQNWFDSRTPLFTWVDEEHRGFFKDAPRPKALTGSERVARYRKKKAGKVEGTFECRICGLDFPHKHSIEEVRQWEKEVLVRYTPSHAAKGNEEQTTDWAKILGEFDG